MEHAASRGMNYRIDPAESLPASGREQIEELGDTKMLTPDVLRENLATPGYAEMADAMSAAINRGR